nr:MAG TPA: nucleoporin [Caudoviricetes sp.]
MTFKEQHDFHFHQLHFVRLFKQIGDFFNDL